MGENPCQKEISQPFFTQSDFSVPNPTNSIHSSRTVSTFLFSYIPKVSTPHELQKLDEGQYVLGFYVFLCWIA